MLFLRKVTNRDIDILFHWANEPSARMNDFHSHQISYEEHREWFQRMINSSDQLQYILMCDTVAVGQIRLSVNGNEAEISYGISEPYRKNGYGKAAIRLIKREVKNEFPYISKLIAKVKPSNIASIYCFEENQFEEKYQQYEYSMERYEPDSGHGKDKEEDKISDGGGVKLLYLTNNKNALPLFRWISRRCEAEILSDRLTVERLSYVRPDIVVSYNYVHLVSRQCIEYVNGNIINMHISLLPWNRGISPNIWSFIDDTPKGVTIHVLSEGLDEGDIIFQEAISFDPNIETFETTYQELNGAAVKLFKSHWDEIVSGHYKESAKKQDGRGSYHSRSDLNALRNQIDFSWTDNIGDFLRSYQQKNTGILNE